MSPSSRASDSRPSHIPAPLPRNSRSYLARGIQPVRQDDTEGRRPALGIRRWSEAGNDQSIGIHRRQFAGGVIAQELIEGSLNPLFYGIGTTGAHIGMLKFWLDDIDPFRLRLLRRRHDAGISPEIRIL